MGTTASNKTNRKRVPKKKEEPMVEITLTEDDFKAVEEQPPHDEFCSDVGCDKFDSRFATHDEVQRLERQGIAASSYRSISSLQEQGDFEFEDVLFKNPDDKSDTRFALAAVHINHRNVVRSIFNKHVQSAIQEARQYLTAKMDLAPRKKFLGLF